MSSFIRGVARAFSTDNTPTTSTANTGSNTPTTNGTTDTTVIEKPTDSATSNPFTKASTPANLFPPTDPAIDGEDCLHDCQTCTIKYPSKFSIEEDDEIYGHIGGWDTHLVVATGKTDWVRDVSDEVGSVMEAVGKADIKPSNGVRPRRDNVVREVPKGLIGKIKGIVEERKHKYLMLSASDMPVPDPKPNQPTDATTVLLLPAWKLIEGVTPALVPELISTHINTAPTNTTPLPTSSLLSSTTDALTTAATTVASTAQSLLAPIASLTVNTPLTTRPCPHNYLILLCSQKTRDARCGQSAPLLRREFERHLRPLGLYRDLHDERPGGCGVYFISHVGGHKYSANVLVFRRDQTTGEAGQCIWLARVRPEDCEGIVRWTLLEGKVRKGERQLRGGYDRGKGVVSW